MADIFQVNMGGLPINEIELLSRWELIESTRRQVVILERKLDQYLAQNLKCKKTNSEQVRKKKLEIVRLKSILKYING
jgi:hypothetical protein